MKKKWFDKAIGDGVVLAAAFVPLPDSNEVSVYRTDNLNESEIWTLGFEELKWNMLHGRGELKTFEVTSESLRVEPEMSEHSLHANITNWPSKDFERENLAMKLALKAKLRINPTPKNLTKRDRI